MAAQKRLIITLHVHFLSGLFIRFLLHRLASEEMLLWQMLWEGFVFLMDPDRYI